MSVDQKKMTLIGMLLLQQVKDRFKTRGGSGGSPWPARMFKTQNHALMNKTGALLRSFKISTTDHSVTVSSNLIYARLHQLGTVGKGGTLPTIRPRKAKALFIPLTDRAEKSVAMGVSGPRGGRMRVGVKLRGKIATPFDLVPGRIKDGVLQKQDRDGEWVDGVPDFIFLRKVDIAPRPMLPDSSMEKLEQTKTIAEVFT